MALFFTFLLSNIDLSLLFCIDLQPWLYCEYIDVIYTYKVDRYSKLFIV